MLIRRDHEMVTIFNNQNRGGFAVSTSVEYNARNLLREVIVAADLDQTSLTYASYLFVGRLLSYYGLKIYLDLNEGQFDFIKPMNLLMTLCELVLYVLIYRYNLIFIALGILDYSRKNTQSELISYLINPVKRRTNLLAATLPTLNIADEQTMHSWLWMRLTTFDYGKKFTLRVEYYASILLVVYILLAAHFYLEILFAANQVFRVTPIFVAVFYDVSLALILLMIMINRTSAANLSFKNDIQMLQAIRQSIHYARLNFAQVINPQNSY